MDDYKAGRIKHASPDLVTSYLFAAMVRQTVGKADGRSVLGSHLLLSTRIFCRNGVFNIFWSCGRAARAKTSKFWSSFAKTDLTRQQLC